jgi:dTDP-glucose pyrophosphorylase
MARITTAVILARGLGTRMRAAGHHQLDAATATVADTGVKALIPIGRPFLDYVMHELAEAQIQHVVLVIGPEHHELRKYYSSLPVNRIRISFATQQLPKGTADAVVAAQAEVGEQPFLVINSDNLYPHTALSALTAEASPGLVGFHRSGLLQGNITADRVAKFAVITSNEHGYLQGISEKPTPAYLAELGPDPLLSMNCWAFDQRIFTACATIKPSPRGELELPDAVLASLQLGAPYRIVKCHAAVLDLSCRDDVASVKAALHNQVVML